MSLFKGETIKVEEGSLDLDIPELGTGRLAKLGVLKFNENGTFTHSS